MRRPLTPFNRTGIGLRTFALIALVVVTGGITVLPVAAEPANEAFVTNQLSNSLSVVDLKTLKTVASIVVTGRPAGIALSQSKTVAYVTAPEGNELIAVDTVQRAIAWRLTVGAGPVGVAVNPVSGFIYVANWYDDEIAEIDPAQRAIARRVKVGRAPSGIAVTADGKSIVSADRESDAVSIIDAASFARVATVKTGTHPFGVNVTPDGKRVFAVNVISNDVTIIDVESRTATTTLAVGVRPYATAFAGGKAFVTNQGAGTISVIDLASLKVIKTIKAGNYPEGIDATADGRSVFVACWEDNTLVKIDVEDLSVAGKADVGDGPRAFGTFLR